MWIFFNKSRNSFLLRSENIIRKTVQDFFLVIRLNLKLLHKLFKEKWNNLRVWFPEPRNFTSALLQHGTALPEPSSQAGRITWSIHEQSSLWAVSEVELWGSGLWCCTGEYILQCICTCRLQLQLKMLNCINSHIAHYQSWIHWSCPWLLTVITDVGDGFQSSTGTSHWRAMRALFCQWISQQLTDN